ncbi:hypothetical protein ACFHYQ_06815 [Sphaerimonospora cavernae]|uniref:Lipoprotein LpqN n=1 Tax=Sphaerimonospora cavernae TaxID=1740611 RepID=A0ABV6U0K9_9ACTN
MRRLRTRRRAVAALLSALLTAPVAACGVEPTEVIDAGPAPVISNMPAAATIYLIRDGRLWPMTVATESPQPTDVMTALFKAERRMPKRAATALSGLTLTQVQLVRSTPDPDRRNDPDIIYSLHMRVTVSGWKISRMAMAQITCTARLRPEIWAVEIVHATPESTGRPKTHTCREFWDLSPRAGRLPP